MTAVPDGPGDGRLHAPPGPGPTPMDSARVTSCASAASGDDAEMRSRLSRRCSKVAGACAHLNARTLDTHRDAMEATVRLRVEASAR